MDKQKLIDLYLDFKNNYLHLQKFADSYKITQPEAKQIINLGKSYYLRGI